MIQRIQIFLGPQRFRALIALLSVTGLLSLVLSAVSGYDRLITALQTLLLLVFIVGSTYLILGRLPEEERKRWLALITPSILAIIIGGLVAPQWTGLFIGAGIGWIVAGIFVFQRIGGPQNYKTAVKAMRKGDYESAIAAMTAQIRQEPNLPEHYRFRAELHRLAGDLELAREDYRRMIEFDSNSAVAFNGLAEVELQSGRFPQARQAAAKAQELAPDEWVAAYNLGMIEDRLENNRAAINQLNSAIGLKIPDSRHRLLVQLYLWRACFRLRDDDGAATALAALRREKAGLEEWQVIMSADEAQALRAVLSDDIEQARRLIADAQVEVLG